MPKRTHKDLSQLAQTGETQVTGLLEPVKEQESTHRTTRVVYIPLSQVLPDRFQSRVILPPGPVPATSWSDTPSSTAVDCCSAPFVICEMAVRISSLDRLKRWTSSPRATSRAVRLSMTTSSPLILP